MSKIERYQRLKFWVESDGKRFSAEDYFTTRQLREKLKATETSLSSLRHLLANIDKRCYPNCPNADKCAKVFNKRKQTSRKLSIKRQK